MDQIGSLDTNRSPAKAFAMQNEAPPPGGKRTRLAKLPPYLIVGGLIINVIGALLAAKGVYMSFVTATQIAATHYDLHVALRDTLLAQSAYAVGGMLCIAGGTALQLTGAVWEMLARRPHRPSLKELREQVAHQEQALEQEHLREQQLADELEDLRSHEKPHARRAHGHPHHKRTD
ncbi:MAG: hypothetical protein NVSMB26_24630 [Beijerinckiaceae bacterium]